jgi:RimJ/RimL family protein N-acetyltransferase
MAHLRDAYGVRCFHVEIDTRNVASQRLAETLGFKREPERRPADPLHGMPAWDFVYRLDLP